MTLTLQIENYDALEDGGPVQFTIDKAGFQVGRNSGADWVLPDPSRHISGRHLEITYSDGAYWLNDISTNGTFLKGQQYRLEGAHKLVHGDRFQVGQYIVAAHLGDVSAVAVAPTAPTASVESDNPWDIGGPVVEPINPIPNPSAHFRNDFADDFISNPMPTAPNPPASPVEPSQGNPASQLGFSSQPLAMPNPNKPAEPAPQVGMPAPTPAPNQPAASSKFFEEFCKGAGLSPADYADINTDELAHELGQSLRATVSEIMALLQNRATVKQFTKGTERTMRSATDNNPMKFLPNADQALEAMFLKPRAGFLVGKAGLDEALQDINMHQAAVFAAIQPALSKLLNDLAPEDILHSADGGVLARSKGAKAWDTYVKRWDAKTHPHDNGILDEFLSHFAQAYADMVKSGQG